MKIATNSAEMIWFGLDAPRVWDTASAHTHLVGLGAHESRRTSERVLRSLNFLPTPLRESDLLDEQGRPLNHLILQATLASARKKGQLVVFVQASRISDGRWCLFANDARQGRYWRPLDPQSDDTLTPDLLGTVLAELQRHVGKPILAVAHGPCVGVYRQLPQIEGVRTCTLAYRPVLELQTVQGERRVMPAHLKRLEAESIYIFREALAEAQNPVMLYSLGKDSSVMLHLARKAFYPGKPPFPLLHVDTRWKFQEMYLFRDYMAQFSGMELKVHVNPDAIARNINPFDHGSVMHTDITKTCGLKQALDAERFDVIFGGARRDEEKSRAKERMFSFRSESHQWDPKKQRPELWNLYNTRKNRGESIRVFPLSNWTELDIWQYIYHENIPVVPLYFAKKRPVVVRNGMMLMVDDDRFRLLAGEEILERVIRFRTLGCYPLTGAIESEARTVPEIILELIQTRHSERQGRAIDSDASASMEKKKQEGYF